VRKDIVEMQQTTLMLCMGKDK